MTLAVIILNWNGKEDTLRCLSSLEKSTTQDFETIVVDNGSTDDSVKAIQTLFPLVTLLETGANLGYAGGNNVGINYALKKSFKWILLLNNDTEVFPDMLSAFLYRNNLKNRFLAASDLPQNFHSHSRLASRQWSLAPNGNFEDPPCQNPDSSSCFGITQNAPEPAIFGAYPLRYKEPSLLDHLGGIWNPQKAQFDLIGFKEQAATFSSTLPLDYICGCSIFIRRDVFEKIGILDERFFLFWEEADFCMRAKSAGFKLGVCPEAKLLHKVSASFTGGSPQKTYFWWRNRFLWIEKNCSPLEKKRLFRKIILPELLHLSKLQVIKSAELFLLKIFARSKDLTDKKTKLKQYRAATTAFLHYKLHRFGPAPKKIMG